MKTLLEFTSKPLVKLDSPTKVEIPLTFRFLVLISSP